MYPRDTEEACALFAVTIYRSSEPFLFIYLIGPLLEDMPSMICHAKPDNLSLMYQLYRHFQPVTESRYGANRDNAMTKPGQRAHLSYDRTIYSKINTYPNPH